MNSFNVGEEVVVKLDKELDVNILAVVTGKLKSGEYSIRQIPDKYETFSFPIVKNVTKDQMFYPAKKIVRKKR